MSNEKYQGGLNCTTDVRDAIGLTLDTFREKLAARNNIDAEHVHQAISCTLSTLLVDEMEMFSEGELSPEVHAQLALHVQFLVAGTIGAKTA